MSFAIHSTCAKRTAGTMPAVTAPLCAWQGQPGLTTGYAPVTSASRALDAIANGAFSHAGRQPPD